MQRMPFTESVLQDLGYALRAFVRHPGFVAVAVLTLALGIGAATAIVNVADALLRRPLPFPDSDRLVSVFATTPAGRRDSTSWLNIRDWKQIRTLAHVAAYRTDAAPLHITGDGAPEPVDGLRASHDLFEVLGVRPSLGRPFNEQEQHERVAVAMIGHALWKRRYAGDPRVLGRTVVINETPHTVVGVLPATFQFPPFYQADVVLPIVERASRSAGYLFAVARLVPGVRVTTAQQELDLIARRLEAAFPDSNRGRGIRVVGLQSEAVAEVRPLLLLLFGAAAMMLLIGCANVGSLLLARGIERQRELAVRSSLGAGPGRLCRQLLTESVFLALLGAALGVVFAVWGSGMLASSLAQRFRLPPIAFNWALPAFAFCCALGSGVLCGLAPAVMVWRSDLNEALKQDGRGQPGGAMQYRLRGLLLVSQTALTVVLLIGAGLLTKSFVRMQQVDLGLNTRQALTADLMLSRRHADPARRDVFLRQILESVRALPGVRAAAVHVDQPFQDGGRQETFRVEGHDDPSPDSGHVAGFNIVTGSFFQAMDLPIVGGRGFDEQDTAASPPVAVVNETMARKFWPGEDAVGKRLRFYYDKDRERWLSIVGIVREVRYRGRLVESIPQVFVPGQQPFYKPQDPFVSIVVRTDGNPAAMTQAVRASIWTVERDLPIWNLEPLDAILWRSAAVPRVSMLLAGMFAGIAVLLAVAGIYAVTAYGVVRRTHELGVRIALGASSRQIRTLAVRHGLVLSVTGVCLGVLGSLALARAVSGFLYGITPTDGPTFLAVPVLFVLVASIAAYVPARRASSIDPAAAFRAE